MVEIAINSPRKHAFIAKNIKKIVMLFAVKECNTTDCFYLCCLLCYLSMHINYSCWGQCLQNIYTDVLCVGGMVLVKVKITWNWYTANIVALRASSKAVYSFNFPARNSPKPTQPWCKPSLHGDEIRYLLYIPYRAGAILSSNIGLVPILHLGVVRLWLTETLPNVSTLYWELNLAHLHSSAWL